LHAAAKFPLTFMRSKKGFVSFILFFVLSFSILTLSISKTIPNSSLTPSYDYKLSYQTHIHLKRSFQPAVQSTLTDLKIQTNRPITTELKYELIRFQILQKFSFLTSEYSNNSQFDCEYYCKDSGLSSTIFPTNSESPPAIFPSDFKTPSLQFLWNQCAQNIEIYEDLSKTKVNINGFYLRTINKITKTQMDSKIESFEVS